MAKLYQFYVCCLRPWLGPPAMTVLQYVMYFQFVNDVTFSHNGPIWRIICIPKRR